MFCPECGTQNPDGSKFCSSCATQLPQVRPGGEAPAGPTKVMPPVGGNPVSQNQPAPYMPPPAPNYGGYADPNQPASGGYANPYQQQPNPGNYPNPYAAYPPQVSTGSADKPSGKAIAAGVLGVTAVFPGICMGIGIILGVIGAILGKAEMDAISRGQVSRSSEVLAKIGFFGGIAGAILSFLFIAACGILGGAG
jgi:hypothetical protein